MRDRAARRSLSLLRVSMSRKTKRRVSDAMPGSLVRYLISPSREAAYLEFRINSFVDLSSAGLSHSDEELSSELLVENARGSSDRYADVLYWEPES